MKLKAYAKVNLTLDIVSRREDGYHDLLTVFQPISLHDTIEIAENGTDELVFSCSDPALTTESNLAVRAYKRMRGAFPKIGGCRIHLHKAIPSGAGLGGGSGDAAAVIRGLSELFGLGLSDQEMIDIGVPLGADIGAMILCRAAMGEGIGEKLTPVGSSFSFPIILYKPCMSFDTCEMYKRTDEMRGACHGLSEKEKEMTASVIEGLQKKDIRMIGRGMHNVFERAVPDTTLLAGQKKLLLSAGAEAALMTGSGSCVFGIFSDKEARDAAFAMLTERTGNPECLIACEAVNR